MKENKSGRNRKYCFLSMKNDMGGTFSTSDLNTDHLTL